MNNAALLSTVESTVELSEEQLNNVNGGGSDSVNYSKSTRCVTKGGVETCTVNENGVVTVTTSTVSK
jgi:hypothetical protein